MKVNEGKEFLKELILLDLAEKEKIDGINITPMLWGVFGVGKTSLIKQLAKELGFDECIVVKMNTLTPVDVRGLPVADLENNRSRFLAPDFIPKDYSKKYLIFFDEINTAPPLSQTAAYEIALERCFGGHKLPKHTCVVMAGNREQDQGATYDMPMPLANRMVHILIEPDADAFINYHFEIGKPIHNSIVAFLKFKPDYISLDINQINEKNGLPAVPSPRVWETLSLCLDNDKNGSMNRNKIAGFISNTIALEFFEFLNYGHKLPSDLKKVLENNETNSYLEIQVEYYYIISLFYKFRTLFIKDPKNDTDHVYNSKIIGTYINNAINSGGHDEIKAFSLSLLKNDKENASSYFNTLVKYDLMNIFKELKTFLIIEDETTV